MQLYRVLIVDDEPIHRREMANLVRSLRSGFEVDEAGNALDALEKLNDKDYNILITDVKMPQMDGLQLIEALGEKMLKMKVVVLSGYDYFDYAKRALILGACDYILKPIDEDDVEKMLCRVEEQLRKQIENERDTQKLQEQLNISYPFFIDYTMNKLANGRISSDDRQKLEGILSGDKEFRVFAVEVLSKTILLQDTDDDKAAEIKSYLKYATHDLLKKHGHTISFFVDKKELVMAGILEATGNNGTIDTPGLKQDLNILISTVLKKFNERIRIGISGLHDSIFDNFSKAFNEAMHSIQAGFYAKKTDILYYESDSKFIDNPPEKNQFLESELRNAILKCDSKSALYFFEKGILDLLEKGMYDPGVLTDFIRLLLYGCLNLVVNVIDKEKYGEMAQTIKESTDACYYLEDLLSDAKSIICNIISSSESITQNKNNYVVYKCVEYINEHLSENITVETLANQFYFNAAYFSTIFKKIMGVGLSEYIFDMRMKKAAHMLKNSSAKIHEVAKKTGFSDEKYFCKAFKRKFGVTPNYYRRFTENGAEEVAENVKKAVGNQVDA